MPARPLIGYYSDMGNRVDDLLRDNLRNERERRKLTQTQVAEMLLPRVRSMHTSTVAKIEAGTRAVHADELSAYADIFGVSVDALLGRTRDGTDLAWAVAKLTSSAQKTASEVHALYDRINADLEDVAYYAADSTAADNVMEMTGEALARLRSCEVVLNELADQFPIPR